MDVWCRDFEFGGLRVDVFLPGGSIGGGDEKGEEKVLEVDAWRTFRGNEWGNKGEKMGVRREGDGWVGIEGVRALGGKEYFIQRAGCEFFYFVSFLILFLFISFPFFSFHLSI